MLEKIIQNKKYFIIGAVLLVACVIIWNVWSNSNVSTDGITANTVREQYKSVGAQQQRAGEAITESKRALSEVRQTNTDIKREIDTSRTINNASSERLADCKRIFREIRESGKVKD